MKQSELEKLIENKVRKALNEDIGNNLDDEFRKFLRSMIRKYKLDHSGKTWELFKFSFENQGSDYTR